ncbi:hypothetical protein [Vibrio nigripulchritudo]|uniref:hypothetical protein n=1 Tax=Vibrio nigripulchritudo TaxID=28173 RepID=UPI00129B150E|nr:hypothetical protein [Vibrio nigripulchritudo]BDU46910.1 hypothetical protein TUMSATVNIG3_57080 [Vibrio nigripulchritudo]
MPDTINTDKMVAYGVTIKTLKAEGECTDELYHRQINYLNIKTINVLVTQWVR